MSTPRHSRLMILGSGPAGYAAAVYAARANRKPLLLTAAASWGAILTIVGFDRLGKGLRAAPRDGVVVYTGKLASLKRFKDDVKEVQQGYECGIGVEGFDDIKDGDMLEAYVREEVKPA